MKGGFFENRDNGVPNGFALSLALSHGEREQIVGNQNMVGLQLSDSLYPWERKQIVGNQNMVGLQLSDPSPRGRGNKL
ncbi:hypothetical protein NEIMUCOT_05488 [Neisseria mucosa ATCC 25996]|uniref:Uncharacterized protein n=1 Tax=Neisseria mucosa (strain ATCC 25996 / DSM 4631 / NCTC 10774 / M26) TaxID=546266 RepID=D2ZXY2_NEIM2|nr:hypothetical protein NEIMUCOT_05488 [Neisseria mucosa ATCC 25996]